MKEYIFVQLVNTIIFKLEIGVLIYNGSSNHKKMNGKWIPMWQYWKGSTFPQVLSRWADMILLCLENFYSWPLCFSNMPVSSLMGSQDIGGDST